MTHQPHRLLALAAFLLTFNCSLGAVVNILPLNASWRYQTNNLDGSSWTQPAYNDAAWLGPGSALLYIETAALPAPKNTLLPANGSGVPWSTYYFRTTFVATNLPQLLSLTFSNLIDDGAVFYLNGVEVKRLRMNAGVITNASVSSATVGDATTYDVFTLQGGELAGLVEGTNFLAVEVHQSGTGSSDIVFGTSITAAYDTQSYQSLADLAGAWSFTTSAQASAAWTGLAYDDSSWNGPSNALLFIESNPLVPAPKNSPLPDDGAGGPCQTYYFRTRVVVSNAAAITSLRITNLVDDGAVFYLNGTEVGRVRMPAGPVNSQTFASATPTGGDITNREFFVLSGPALAALQEGTNVFAAEVHQATSNSTDVVFGASLTAVYGWPESALTRGPYLQLSTPDSIVIRWRTDLAVDTRVLFGTNLASLDQVYYDASAETEHIATLTGMEPDTRYYYAVGNSGTNLAGSSANHFFWTHPQPGTIKDLRVWVIGDAGTKTANQQAVRNAFTNFNGTNTLHAWLQLGDNAYDNGTDSEYQLAVFNMYPDLLRNSVTWPTLGNHDTAQSSTYVDTYPYFNIFTLPTAGEAGGVPSATEHYYSFDLGMVHFICLDSMTANRATNGAMANWLRADLGLNTNRWTVAFWHHPPYTKGSHDSDAETQLGEVRTNLLPILEAGGVDLVLTGHSHSYERSFLIDSHQGPSGTFSTLTNIVQAGDGRETNGVGAYLKPDGLGESQVPNRGTVYAVAGSSGQISGGALNHPAMATSQNVLGSMVLDFRSNRLDVLFLRETGATNDWFSVIKTGTHPPLLTNAVKLLSGDFQFTVLTRAYRTNIVEATASLAVPNWQPVSTNVSTNAEFPVLIPASVGDSNRFFRVQRR